MLPSEAEGLANEDLVWCLSIVWGKRDLYIARCKEEGGIQHRLKDGQLDFSFSERVEGGVETGSARERGARPIEREKAEEGVEGDPV